MKVLYLLNRVQRGRIESITRGADNDDHLYGMLRLPHHGVETGYLEIEQYFPARLCRFLRRHVLNIYWVHLPLFFKFFSYDIIFTSSAFGSQVFHALYPFKKPKWVMLDFSIAGFLGASTTFKQKLFAYLVAHADGVVTIDEHEREEMLRRFPALAGKVTFLRFAVDTDFFKPHYDVREETMIFSPGRDPGRDFKTLFAATEGLGVPVMLTARERTIKKLLPLPAGVSNYDLTTEDYVATFARAGIVVIPLDTRSGVNNAMGLSTLVEAMTMGKAIIATHTPAVGSYITHGKNGILVPPQDPQALREAIRELLGDPQKRAALGKEARAFAEAHCAAEVFARDLAAYFNNVTA